jgi:hypothetical protein
MARPPSPTTKNFLRILSDPQRMILLSAGQGNISRGFENVLALYQHCHNEGYRTDMELSSLGIAVKQQTTLNRDSQCREGHKEQIDEYSYET